MAWIMDTYSMHNGGAAPAVVTGKPLLLGGSEGRFEATGRGAVFAIEEAARAYGIDLSTSRAAVQGFGNGGATAAKLLSELGPKVVAVSDSHGGIYNPNGLDIHALLQHKRDTDSILGFPEAENITNEELLEIDCDILVPAVLEGQLTDENALQVQVRLIAEVANGPSTPEADRIFEDRGIIVLPDIYANAGGVTVSYFEWVQGLNRSPGPRTRSTAGCAGSWPSLSRRWTPQRGSTRSVCGPPLSAVRSTAWRSSPGFAASIRRSRRIEPLDRPRFVPFGKMPENAAAAGRR
jgi:glutamate dehydrogenase (NAD(P)+)